MRATVIRTVVLLTGPVLLGWSGADTKPEDTGSNAATGSARGNPTLFEVRQQCDEIAAFFPVDVSLARHWVPAAYKLELNAQGKAEGALIFMNCPKYSLLITPNSPQFQGGENTAPGAFVHLWFMLQGAGQVLPVPDAQVTAPTRYAYAVADFVTSPSVARVYRRAGKNAVVITAAALIDEGKRQTGRIVFPNGRKITLEAGTATQLATPLRVGGNIWNWHLADQRGIDDALGVHLEPATGQRAEVNTTRVMFLAIAPGAPNTTRVTIHAESGTLFADYFGTHDLVALRSSFFRPNNIVNNSSRGELVWTTYPPYPVKCPPLFPD